MRTRIIYHSAVNGGGETIIENAGTSSQTVRRQGHGRDNPNFSEYFANREEYDGKSTGMDVGELCNVNGVPAKVLHEEYDAHTGTVKQIVQRSSQTGSGTYEVEWHHTDRGKLTVGRHRRIFS